jgi:hypothetical protein
VPNITVTFIKCIQDSQEYGSDDEHMVSCVVFTIEVDGENSGEFCADLKQTVGDSYETGAIEVGRPAGYKGPFNQQEFSKCAEQYFRSLVGSKGRGIRIEGGGNIRMQNNTYEFSSKYSFNSEGSSGGW